MTAIALLFAALFAVPAAGVVHAAAPDAGRPHSAVQPVSRPLLSVPLLRMPPATLPPATLPPATLPPVAAPPLQLTTADLPGWDIAAAETYSAKQLYGYINGGAEIYLEYGFRQVRGQRCTQKKHEVQVDIYEMVNPEAAFGMFSVLRGRCSGILPGTRWHCVTPEQILFAKGAYLISIVPFDRAAESRNASMKAAKVLLARIKGAEFRVPAQFRSAPLSTSQKNLRFVRGPLALQSVLDEWMGWLDGIDRFDMYHTVVGDGGRSTEAAAITFRQRRDAERFLKQCAMTGAEGKGGWRSDEARALAVRERGGLTVHTLFGPQMPALRSTWR